MFTSISVPDLESTEGRHILTFGAAGIPDTPVSTILDFVKSSLVEDLISFSTGDTHAGGMERVSDDTEIPTIGIISATTISPTPPASIDFFIKLSGDYWPKIVFQIGTATLLDAVFSVSPERIYSSVLFKLPIIGESGIRGFRHRIFAKIPSAWGEASALELFVAMIGYPPSSEYVEPIS